MKIGINTSCVVSGGAVTHLRSVIPLMLTMLEPGDEIVFFGSTESRRQIQPPEGTRWIENDRVGSGLVSRIWWENVQLPKLLKRNEIDVLFHSGNFAAFRAGIPQVIVIHNLAPYLANVIEGESIGQRLRLWLLRTLTKWSLPRVSATIFLSKWGRELVLGGAPEDDRWMPIIPFGCEHGAEAVSTGILDEIGIEADEYVLTVSHLYRYKRLDYLIDAYVKLGQRVANLPLVVVGAPYDRGYAERMRERAKACQAPVHFTGILGKDEVAELMQKCRLFVFSSEAENLPITLLEAMSAECAIVTNRTCSMPETCEDAVRYVNPTSVDGYVRELEDALWDETIRKDLASRALARSRDFRWANTARQTIDFLRSVHARTAR